MKRTRMLTFLKRTAIFTVFFIGLSAFAEPRIAIVSTSGHGNAIVDLAMVELSKNSDIIVGVFLSLLLNYADNDRYRIEN